MHTSQIICLDHRGNNVGTTDSIDKARDMVRKSLPQFLLECYSGIDENLGRHGVAAPEFKAMKSAA